MSLAHEAQLSGHELADLEDLLNELERSRSTVSVSGSPISVTQAVRGHSGMEYSTVPYYTLLDEERKPITVQSTVVGHEYRFTGLEVDIEHGTAGGYITFNAAAVLATLHVIN